MPGTRREPFERAIIYAGTLGEVSREKINEQLKAVGARDLPESSYRSIRKFYVPYFKNGFDRLGRAIYKPPTWAEVGEAMRIPEDADANGSPTED